MVYLPNLNPEDTTFPNVSNKDINAQVRMIEAKFARLHPEVDYYSLLKATTPVDAGANETTGEAGNTKFDPIWGESVPDSDGWEQPHGNATPDAAETEQFASGVPIRMRIDFNPRNQELTKFGFDESRELICYVPVSLLDAAGVTVKPGDEFVWAGRRFLVKQYEQGGYLWNTAVFLYLAIAADTARRGS